MWAPGSQRGSSWPSGSARSSTTTPSAGVLRRRTISSVVNSWTLAPAFVAAGAVMGYLLRSVWRHTPAGLQRRGRWWTGARRGRQVDGLEFLERVQPLWAEFAPHAALFDAAERRDGIVDIVIDSDGPRAHAAGDVGRPFGIR